MAKRRYEPPVQSRTGMMFDAVLMLVLVFVSLSAPIWIKNFSAPAETASEASTAAEAAAAPTWESLGQNPTMAAQWEKLGKDPASAKAMIESRFDYSIDPLKLLLTVALVIVYFVFMLRTSEKEYREVIAEKFDRD